MRTHLFAHIPLIIRSFFKRELVSDMNSKNQRALCQQLWARNKYLVLSHSSNIYNEICQYLKNGLVKLSQVQLMIDRACQIPKHKGEVCKEDLLAPYLNAYLQKLTLLKGDLHETLA